ncbi:unnamed protein product [Fraxinus pennsylvanica]|uniref:Diacylglycerol O-acyltransferase n=1 Tax=Fraxinus pennsylvanica TaxID=56036 RepID=A0AAD2EEG0_9LAMI|nr:unnamed protein product [Fraxinus pennsylvanica]
MVRTDITRYAPRRWGQPKINTNAAVGTGVGWIGAWAVICDQTETMVAAQMKRSVGAVSCRRCGGPWKFELLNVSSKGTKKWKRVEVNPKDHVHVPVFPSGMSTDYYDEVFNEYLSKLTMEQFPENRPLWEIHIVKYPTRNAAENLIFKLHHSLGDGYSLMGALLSCLQRLDNPSMPLTFPSRQPNSRPSRNSHDFFKPMSQFFSGLINTAYDFGLNLLKSSLIKDDKSPIRSGEDGVEFRPIVLTTTTFSMDHLKQIKDRLKVAVSRFIHGSLHNSSLAISNMMGPVEPMALANRPIKGLYFAVAGAPQSLSVTMVSYVGKLRICMGVEKGFIDPEKFKSCIENAFEAISKAALESPTETKL